MNWHLWLYLPQDRNRKSKNMDMPLKLWNLWHMICRLTVSWIPSCCGPWWTPVRPWPPSAPVLNASPPSVGPSGSASASQSPNPTPPIHLAFPVVYNIYLLMPGFEGTMLYALCPKNQALIGLVHHFSRKYCIMTSTYCRCDVYDVILNDKGRNTVEQNAIVHDDSDRALLLQSPNVVNQWISKNISCDALIINSLFIIQPLQFIPPFPFIIDSLFIILNRLIHWDKRPKLACFAHLQFPSHVLHQSSFPTLLITKFNKKRPKLACIAPLQLPSHVLHQSSFPTLLITKFNKKRPKLACIAHLQLPSQALHQSTIIPDTLNIKV